MTVLALPADRCALVVEMAAVRANWRAVRQSFSGAGVGAVVKQDAYGLGIAEVVPLLAALGCRDFWVADLQEAADVRRVEPSGRIFVLHGLAGGTLADYQALGAIPVLVDMSEVEALARISVDAPAACAIHLDTGLNRLGLGLAEVRRLAAEPDLLGRLQVAAYVTHLAHFSDPGARANQWQWRRFSAWTRHLPPAPRSFSASSGVFGPKERHGDLARVGSALYGVETTPSRPQPIVAAATLTAPILRVHHVPAGREVGYSGAYRTRSARRLAQLGIGYGDGVPYRFHGDAHVLIDGHRAPVVSTSAMSLMSVDVTDLPEEALRPGLRAVLFGPGLPVDQIAAAAGVAPNVVHVRAGRSAPRFYLPCPDEPGAATAAAPRPHHAPQMA